MVVSRIQMRFWTSGHDWTPRPVESKQCLRTNTCAAILHVFFFWLGRGSTEDPLSSRDFAAALQEITSLRKAMDSAQQVPCLADLYTGCIEATFGRFCDVSCQANPWASVQTIMWLVTTSFTSFFPYILRILVWDMFEIMSLYWLVWLEGSESPLTEVYMIHSSGSGLHNVQSGWNCECVHADL